MKRRDILYAAVIAVLSVLYILAEISAPRPLDWTPTFNPAHTSPYGTYIIDRVLKDAFPGVDVVSTEQPVFNLLRDNERVQRPFNLLIVNSILARGQVGMNFEIDPYETELLLGFVEDGGTVFLAAETYGGALGDSLNLDTAPSYFSRVFGDIPGANDAPADSSSDDAATNNADLTEVVRVSFTNPRLNALSFEVPQQLATWHFTSVDTARTRILATTESFGDDNPSYIRVDRGEGALFVSTMPYAFTNFGLVDSAATGWTFAALSHLPVQTTLWSTNYIPGRGQSSQTPLRFILSEEPLRWAWFIMIGAATLFILFRARRRQRVIPVVQPHENVTLQFVDNVGRLYYQRGNHGDLAQKKILHFQEYLRSRLGIDGRRLDEQTRARIAARSGVTPDLIDSIAAEIGQASRSTSMSSSELTALSKPIDAFYNLARR